MVTEGTYELKAAATDNSGQTVFSSPVTVRVKEKPYSHFYTEDFNDGLAQKWTGGDESWTVEENIYHSPGSAGTEISTYNGSTFRDYHFSVRASPAGNDYFGMVFHYQDRENYHYAGLVVSPAIAVLKRVSGGEEVKLEQMYYPAAGTGMWIDLELINSEGRTTLRINDSTILSNIPTPGTDSGRIGLFTRNNEVLFDDVEIAAKEMWLMTGMPGHAGPWSGILVYPNPVTGSFFRVIPEDHSATGAMEIFDLTGKPVYSAPVRHPRVTIPTDVLGGPGIYILKVSGKDRIHTSRIIFTGEF
jgi:hypothetical protein